MIYELHLRGFTRHSSSGVAHPGTYLGLIEKIPYLQSLGITTVELMPLLEFDETENFRRNPVTGERLLNFWGYSPVSFFAPKAAYAADSTPGAAQDELMAMIDAFHAAGLEVFVDVVYNHTAEGGGGASDPLHSFRGLAEDVYYLRDPATGRPFDVTGCGNTVNTNHPVVRRMILDSLRFWAEEIGVDGFRFDLAAAFYRGLAGEKLAASPLAAEIAADPVLAQRLLIAEPWDVTGFTPPAGFPPPWREWNGAFRDDVRRFVRGDEVAPRTLELRLAGSPDLFPAPHSRAAAIDFVTCHDGFPLADLVSYSTQGEPRQRRRGPRRLVVQSVVEPRMSKGRRATPEILATRERQVANFLALLLLSRGTPMLLAGDERGRSQRGNNNAWCQDNEISWLDWRRSRRRPGGASCAACSPCGASSRRLDFAEWSAIAPFHPAGSGLGRRRGRLLLRRATTPAAEPWCWRSIREDAGPLSAAARPRRQPWRLAFDTASSRRRAARRRLPDGRGSLPGPRRLAVQPPSIRILLGLSLRSALDATLALWKRLPLCAAGRPG